LPGIAGALQEAKVKKSLTTPRSVCASGCGGIFEWIGAVDDCLLRAKNPLPGEVERRELAQFVLSTMEGGVMQAPEFRDAAYFNVAAAQLPTDVDRSLREASGRHRLRLRIAARSGNRRTRS
jgi:hypothetical protein